jgi:hypothetical protein
MHIALRNTASLRHDVEFPTNKESMMRIAITAITVILSAAASVSSVSAFTSKGVVHSIDGASGTLWLRNGDAYQLPAGADLSGYAPGSWVSVYWESQNPNRISDGSSEGMILLLQAYDIQPAY